jgi:hypothetical protein
MAKSHGPSSSVALAKVALIFPLLSRTKSDPACGLLPLVVGTLPTITKPFFSTPSAVVKPSGRALKKSAVCPFGDTLTIVVLVPWALVLLLKFETRISPG